MGFLVAFFSLSINNSYLAASSDEPQILARPHKVSFNIPISLDCSSWIRYGINCLILSKSAYGSPLVIFESNQAMFSTNSTL